MSPIGTVKDLLARAEVLQKNRSKLLAAVDALQDTCEHDWKSTGYDPRGSGTEAYKCALCGAEKSV